MSKTQRGTLSGGEKETGRDRSIRFREEDVERLRALAHRWQCSMAAAARKAVVIAAEHELAGAVSGSVGEGPPTGTTSFWDKIDELVQSIPAEEIDRLPVDGSEQHDHYIYGTPKRGR